MKIHFIGTGSGKTSLQRFHSSILITSGDFNLLIDCGDGISKALLFNNINFHSIDGILISHFHPDHYSGLVSLLIQMKLSARKNKLVIFIHKDNLDFLNSLILQSYIFIEKLGFELNFIDFYEDESIKINELLTFFAKQNSHLDKYKDLDKENKLSFKSSSILIRTEKNTIMYTGDVGKKEDLFLFNSNKIDVMISEISHIELSDILNSFRLQEISNLCLTHFSDTDEYAVKNFIALLPEDEKKKIISAYDGLILNF